MSGDVLGDGAYDVIIVDATSHDDGSRTVEFTLLAGEHKGEIVALRTTDLDGDDLDLLGIPGTLTVTDGTPHFRTDP